MDLICEWQAYAMKQLVCLLFRGKTSNIKCMYCKYRRELND